MRMLITEAARQKFSTFSAFSRRLTRVFLKNKIIFQKPLDKQVKILYNTIGILRQQVSGKSYVLSCRGENNLNIYYFCCPFLGGSMSSSRKRMFFIEILWR